MRKKEKKRQEKSQCDQCCLSGQGHGFFQDIHVKNVKLCMTVVLLEIYAIHTPSPTVGIFQGHSGIKLFKLKVLFPACPSLNVALLGWTP